jgi:magnesium transporter
MVAGTDREPAVDAKTPTPRIAEAGKTPGVVAASVYAHGKRVADVAIDEAGEWAKRPGHLVWIGLFEPSYELLARVQAQFDLHPLAIEDAGKAHQHPKLEQYGEALFVVARTAQMVDERIAFGETHIFIGRGYVVTVRHGASTSYAAVRQRCESCPTVLSHGEHYVLYAILDFIVDNYLPVVETIHEEVEAIEDRVFAAVPDKADPTMQPLFRDVTDHVLRVQEEIDMLREVLAFAFEASLLNGQAEQTSITRRLAAWAAILAVPTAIAGIYGMNFEYMPELKWGYGYFLVLGVVATICGTLYVRLKHYGWL